VVVWCGPPATGSDDADADDVVDTEGRGDRLDWLPTTTTGAVGSPPPGNGMPTAVEGVGVVLGAATGDESHALMGSARAALGRYTDPSTATVETTAAPANRARIKTVPPLNRPPEVRATTLDGIAVLRNHGTVNAARTLTSNRKFATRSPNLLRDVHTAGQ
jgi:hypothetical protein